MFASLVLYAASVMFLAGSAMFLRQARRHRERTEAALKEKGERLEKLERRAVARHTDTTREMGELRAILELQKNVLNTVCNKTVALQDNVETLQVEAEKPFDWPPGSFGWALKQMEAGETLRCASDPERRKFQSVRGIPLDSIMWATDWELVPLTIVEILDRCKQPHRFSGGETS